MSKDYEIDRKTSVFGKRHESRDFILFGKLPMSLQAAMIGQRIEYDSQPAAPKKRQQQARENDNQYGSLSSMAVTALRRDPAPHTAILS